ncbi:hypothetical protein ACS48_00205 [Bacillus cereus]|nr:hypothetical protein ACS48_00205 [Bacillus cereus]
MRRHRLVDDGDDVGLGPGIGDHGLGHAALLPHVRDGVLDRLGAVHRDQPGALAGEQQRSRAADAAAGAGDDDGFALPAAHAFLPRGCRRRLPRRGISNRISNGKVS